MEREWEEQQQRRREEAHRRWVRQRKIDELERHVELWHKSKQIREYASAAEAAGIVMLGTALEVNGLHEWVQLAYEVADEMDPFVDAKATTSRPD